MSQRHSEYELVPGDSYYTPAWVTEALLNAEDFPQPVWEPASGAGHMGTVLSDRFVMAGETDIWMGPRYDFLSFTVPYGGAKSIVTNPPYSSGLAEKFVRHAFSLTRLRAGKVAMLLPHGFDTAKGRRDLFSDNLAFKAKHTLTRRIRWANLEQKANGPSSNHAWFVWDWKHSGPPTLGYLP